MDKMFAKQQFKCAICGTIYDELKDRIVCESKCVKRQEEKAKRLADAKKKEEQEARWSEVEAVRKHYEELYEAYLKDYEPEAYNSAIGYYNWIDNIMKMFGE